MLKTTTNIQGLGRAAYRNASSDIHFAGTFPLYSLSIIAAGPMTVICSAKGVQ